MATEKKFLAKSMNDLLVKRYLESELKNAGVSSIDIQKTPLATRIAIRVKRPSLVIGKKGATVKSITEKLEKDFLIDNPQLDIIEVDNSSLDAKLVAEKIARQIEIEGNIKQILRINMRDVMESGAIGVELLAAGKVVGKGGKAKTLRARSGYMKKSGDLLKMIDMAKATAYLKAGAIGIKAKIVRPGTIFPDAIKIDYEKLSNTSTEEAMPTGEPTKEDLEARAAEERMKAKIAAAKLEAKARVERKKKGFKAVKKKPTYEAENLIKSAEPETHAKPEEKPAA
ncbi:MAG: 30S ribosomal protein S3 [Candidatus Micrarchaeota archaeon]